jgi:DnaJ-class molecular chaperone
MGVKRRKAPQVFPCIDCEGTGKINVNEYSIEKQELRQWRATCERCEGEGIER